jgi:hypothetical protein
MQRIELASVLVVSSILLLLTHCSILIWDEVKNDFNSAASPQTKDVCLDLRKAIQVIPEAVLRFIPPQNV